MSDERDLITYAIDWMRQMGRSYAKSSPISKTIGARQQAAADAISTMRDELAAVTKERDELLKKNDELKEACDQMIAEKTLGYLKTYNTALTPEEIRRLYEKGQNDE